MIILFSYCFISYYNLIITLLVSYYDCFQLTYRFANLTYRFTKNCSMMYPDKHTDILNRILNGHFSFAGIFCKITSNIFANVHQNGTMYTIIILLSYYLIILLSFYLIMLIYYYSSHYYLFNNEFRNKFYHLSP
jgi:hypothetical protein